MQRTRRLRGLAVLALAPLAALAAPSPADAAPEPGQCTVRRANTSCDMFPVTGHNALTYAVNGGGTTVITVYGLDSAGCIEGLKATVEFGPTGDVGAKYLPLHALCPYRLTVANSAPGTVLVTLA